MSARLFAVAKAYYYIDGTGNEIAGVPEYEREYYGEYTGIYPSQAASKAFTGLQKHMKKFYTDGWFPGYDPKDPPIIVFKLVDVNNGEGSWYEGQRIPHRQGVRTVVNQTNGRVRSYRWQNKVVKINYGQQGQQSQQGQQRQQSQQGQQRQQSQQGQQRQQSQQGQQSEEFNPKDLLD